MRKVIAAINMTLDGFCDHTSITTADEELHEHYTDLLRNGGAILYGRITYQLMEFWPSLVKKPSGVKSMDDFALAIDHIPKIVFSRTLKDTGPQGIGWQTATLAQRSLEEEVGALKQKEGKDIFVGSRSLIVALMNLHLLDEFQLCVHPVIVGKGLPLLQNINDTVHLKLLKTKTFGSGAITLYYQPVKK